MTPADPRAAAIEKLLTDEVLRSAYNTSYCIEGEMGFDDARRIISSALLALPVAETGWQEQAEKLLDCGRDRKMGLCHNCQRCLREQLTDDDKQIEELQEQRKAIESEIGAAVISAAIAAAKRALPAPPEPPEGTKTANLGGSLATYRKLCASDEEDK